MSQKYSPTRHLLSVLLFAVLMALSFATAQAKPSYSEPQLLKESEAVFSNPGDILISPEGGYLLVADTGNNEIKILQPGTLKILSKFGAGHLNRPVRLSFLKNGTLRVTDNEHARVTSYTFKGVFRDGSANVEKLEVTSLSPASPIAPEVATDPNGQSYRIDTNGGQIVISDEDNNHITFYGSGILKAPQALETVGRYFWIADSGNNRILLLKAPRPSGP